MSNLSLYSLGGYLIHEHKPGILKNVCEKLQDMVHGNYWCQLRGSECRQQIACGVMPEM